MNQSLIRKRSSLREARRSGPAFGRDRTSVRDGSSLDLEGACQRKESWEKGGEKRRGFQPLYNTLLACSIQPASRSNKGRDNPRGLDRRMSITGTPFVLLLSIGWKRKLQKNECHLNVRETAAALKTPKKSQGKKTFWEKILNRALKEKCSTNEVILLATT